MSWLVLKKWNLTQHRKTYTRKHKYTTKIYCNTKVTQKTKARFSYLLRHPDWKRSRFIPKGQSMSEFTREQFVEFLQRHTRSAHAHSVENPDSLAWHSYANLPIIETKLEFPSLGVLPTAFRPLTLTFKSSRAMVMTHTHAKGQGGQMSLESKVRVEKNGQTEAIASVSYTHLTLPTNREV